MPILNTTKTKIQLLEKFVVDGKLPKYTDIPEGEVADINRGKGRSNNTAVYDTGSVYTITNNNATRGTTTGTFGSGSTTYVTVTGNVNGDSVSYPPATEDQGVTENDRILTFDDFFGYVRHNASFLSNMRYRRKVKGLMKLIVMAKETGQATLGDMTAAELDRLKLEYILASKGFKTYVDEQYVVEGAKRLKPELYDLMEFEWLKDFSRIIPPKIIKRMHQANKLHVFDNYAIMHIKPEWYGKPETKKSQDSRKDPILFGMMNVSRRLYYIGDWVDQYCQLNLADLIDKFGDSAAGVNEIWSRTDTRLPFEGAKHSLPVMAD